MTKAEYIEQMQGLHSRILEIKDELKEVIKEANSEDYDGSVLSTIALKRAQGKLSEYIEDLENTLSVIRN